MKVKRLKVEALKADLPGAREVVSLTAGKDAYIYGGTTGAKGSLFFRYDPRLKSFENLGAYVRSGIQLFAGSKPVEQKIHHALVASPNGKIYGGTGQNISMGSPYYKTDEDDGGHVFEYDPSSGRSKDLGIPVPHEWIINLTCDAKCENLYGMTYPLNRVFMCNIASGKMRILGQVRGVTRGDSGCSHETVCDLDGNLYGSCGAGFLFKYDRKRDQLLETEIALPDGDYRIDSLVRTPDGLIYGGTWESGYLFRFDPSSQKLETVARPNEGARMPALAFFEDCLFGAAGGGEQYGTRSAFLFEHDPKRQKTKEIGDIVDEKSGVRASRIHTMTVSNDGIIYAGETGAPRVRTQEDIETGIQPYFYVCTLA